MLLWIFGIISLISFVIFPADALVFYYMITKNCSDPYSKYWNDKLFGNIFSGGMILILAILSIICYFTNRRIFLYFVPVVSFLICSFFFPLAEIVDFSVGKSLYSNDITKCPNSKTYGMITYLFLAIKIICFSFFLVTTFNFLFKNSNKPLTFNKRASITNSEED